MQRFLLLITLSMSISSFAQTLITNTTIVDVEKKKLLPLQQVLIQDGKITAISAKIKAPVDTDTIDGRGQYLVPGFVDAHVHFFQSGGIYARPDAIDLRKFKPY